MVFLFILNLINYYYLAKIISKFDYKSRYMFSCDHAGKVLVWHAGIAG